jgi:hypothetical protein
VLALVTGSTRSLAAPLVMRATGIALAAGYLFKAPFIAAAPLAASVAAAAATERGGGARLPAALAAVAPVLVLAAIWKGAIDWVRFPPPVAIAPPAVRDILADAAREIGAVLSALPVHHVGMLGVGVLVALAVVSRGMLLAIVVGTGCYLGGLLALYGSGHFASEAAGIAPALMRYVGVVGAPLAYGASALALVLAAMMLQQRPWVSAALAVLLTGCLVTVLGRAIREVDTLEPGHAGIMARARRARDLVAAGATRPPRVMPLAREMETGRMMKPVLQYVSLERGGAPAWIPFGRPHVVPASTPVLAPGLTSPVTPRTLKRRVRGADAVWVESADPWVRHLLRRATRNPDCVGEGVLLRRPMRPSGARGGKLLCAPVTGMPM